MRVLKVVLIGLGLLALGCPKAADPWAPKPKTAIESLFHGSWSGRARTSPLGSDVVYALNFLRDPEGRLVAETPRTLGGKPLPPGAYQRMLFTRNDDGDKELHYKASLGERGMAEGVLALNSIRTSSHNMVYCSASKGGCEAMELRFSTTSAVELVVKVFIRGELHADIPLGFDFESH